MKKSIKFLVRHLVLVLLSAFWLVPIIWLVATSFSGYAGINIRTFFPETWTIQNYVQLFRDADTVAQFPKWFMNTFVIATFSCIIASSFVLMVSYAISCMRFKGRKMIMNVAVLLQLFPGFLSMIAIYFILKAFNLTNSHIGMILVYSGSAGLGYLVAKGFFDTVPITLRESATLEGASEEIGRAHV